MIIGAGENQVPIINLAKQKGYYTIAVSIDGDYPGFKCCDQKCIVDVREKEYILNIAKKEKICGILTDQTDIAVPTVAYVAEKLGLPGIGYECALCFTDKVKMRKCCEGTDITTIGYHQASIYEEAKKSIGQLRLPLIIKPVDNQGSRGVSRIDSYENFHEKFSLAKKYSASGTVIIEEFFQGQEIVIEGFASNFQFQNLIIGDSENFDISDMFIPRQRLFPTTLNREFTNKVLALNKKLVEKMGLKFGITHSEYLVNENSGEICLMEIAARGGGVFISSDLIPLGCRIDVNDLLIELATGGTAAIDMQKFIEASSGYLCFMLPEGIIRKVEGLKETNDIEGVHRACFDNIYVGRKISGIKDKTSRLGPILIANENRTGLQETINKIKNTLNIEVETENGIKTIIW